MDSLVLFESVVYRKELPEYVDNLNKITNDYLHKARKEAKDSIYEREKKYGVKKLRPSNRRPKKVVRVLRKSG